MYNKYIKNIITNGLYYFTEILQTIKKVILICKRKVVVYPDKKGNYTINYMIHGKEYIISLKLNHFPSEYEILDITTEPESKDIIKYFGPNNDFHGNKITPKKIGLRKVKINIIKDMETIENIFCDNEIIEL